MMKSHFLIEILVGSCTNIGDALMLYSIVQQLNNAHNLATLPSIADYQTRARLGLLQKFGSSRLGDNLSALLGNVIPVGIQAKYGLVTEKQIQGILDAKGFAYGDSWGVNKVRRMAKQTVRWKKQGKRIVLLPQTYGPFENNQIRNGFLKILENTHLVYARDKASYDHIRHIAGECAHLRSAPDFTSLVQGQRPASFKPQSRQACIIPNHRMLDSSSPEVSARYLSFLKLCFQCFSEREMNPFVLLHDIKWDYSVALSLQQELGRTIPIVHDDNPVYVKGIIGSCHLVLSSRFHGLINALSQGVPCLATAWTHKFRELMMSYHGLDFLVHPFIEKESLLEKIRLLDEPASRQSIIDRIKKTCERDVKRIRQMWEEIEEIM